ncbi:TetR/AcrR family transcriptional regulator [Hyphomicrobium sp.]|jgi:AcrR family transcriptional regulator|uniref:TetR/AcrR family transcriptional regulator n=1 Tax=Hyphomicrobium sp. TaxID=82 RepID=UPI002BE1F893|nr:TetR/AcrR family transcriptional regulator [Hyphomicrobium sp.]HVZ04080.1 TetR/AcrR family transcriptional regulator [Hyphomicrobium sp.]
MQIELPMKKIRTLRRAKPKLGRRSAEESGPSREELARIALQLFAERHFASVSIRDIGRAANVNSSMIYYHYNDKQELFRAAIETAIDAAFALFAAHCNRGANENPVDAIDKWFDVHVELSSRLRNVIKISLDCRGVVGAPDADEPIKRFYQHENEILQNLIREGMRQGLFRKVDPRVVATMISTMLDGVMARSFIFEDFNIVATVQEFKRTLWEHLGYRTAQSRMTRAARVGATSKCVRH